MLLDCTHVRLRRILENFDISVLPEDAMQEIRDSITVVGPDGQLAPFETFTLCRPRRD